MRTLVFLAVIAALAVGLSAKPMVTAGPEIHLKLLPKIVHSIAQYNPELGLQHNALRSSKKSPAIQMENIGLLSYFHKKLHNYLQKAEKRRLELIKCLAIKRERIKKMMEQQAHKRDRRNLKELLVQNGATDPPFPLEGMSGLKDSIEFSVPGEKTQLYERPTIENLKKSIQPPGYNLPKIPLLHVKPHPPLAPTKTNPQQPNLPQTPLEDVPQQPNPSSSLEQEPQQPQPLSKDQQPISPPAKPQQPNPSSKQGPQQSVSSSEENVQNSNSPPAPSKTKPKQHKSPPTTKHKQPKRRKTGPAQSTKSKPTKTTKPRPHHQSPASEKPNLKSSKIVTQRANTASPSKRETGRSTPPGDHKQSLQSKKKSWWQYVVPNFVRRGWNATRAYVDGNIDYLKNKTFPPWNGLVEFKAVLPDGTSPVKTTPAMNATRKP